MFKALEGCAEKIMKDLRDNVQKNDGIFFT